MLLIVYLLKVSACLGLFYGLYYFLFRRFTFHRLNRVYLLLALLLSFMIPLVEFEQKRIVEIVPMEAEPISLPQNEVFEERSNDLTAELGANTSDPEEVVSAAENLPALTWEQWSIGVYGIGLLTALLVLARRLWKIALLSRKRQNEADQDWVEVSESFTAASFFGLIFLNSQTLTEEEKQQVLLHEQTHAQLFHSVDVLLVELCKVILWFNPVIYLCKKSLVEIHEYEVDERLVAQLDAKIYAHLILKLATQSSHSLIHSFGKHPVTNRIQFLFQKPTIAMKKGIYVIVLLLGVAGVLAFAPRKEVIIYKEKPDAAKKVKEMPVKIYPLKAHNKHVWWYLEQKKKPKLKEFSENNLTLNDLVILPGGAIYYLVNPNSFNSKDIKIINELIAKHWKVEISVTEQVVDAEGKLSKIGLAVKNLRTNQLATHEVIDMVEARELGRKGAYLDLQIKNPYWKPQIALVYGDKSLTVNKCSKMEKDHLIHLVANESSFLKISKDQIAYTVYPDKVNLKTFQMVSDHFKKEGFSIMTTDEKYDSNHRLSAVKVALYNDDNEVMYPVVLDELRHYADFGGQTERHRLDEPITLRANKITGKVQIEVGTMWTKSLKKKGHLKPFVPEKTDHGKSALNEDLSKEEFEEYEDFNKIQEEMRLKSIFFLRTPIKTTKDKRREMLVFRRGGEGVGAFGLMVDAGTSPTYYLDGKKVQEDVVKLLRPEHISKVDYVEPHYKRFGAFVKKHGIGIEKGKFVWIERKEFDFKKLPAATINRKLSLRLEPADTIRTFLPANDLGKNPLVLINGEEFPASVLTRVDPTKFGMTFVAKPNDPQAISKYGIRAADGVVDIKTIDDCFFKTEEERMVAVEHVRKMLIIINELVNNRRNFVESTANALATSKERFNKQFVTNNNGKELMLIVVRGFEHNAPFLADFPKNAKIIYLMDGKPVNEEQINKYEGKFQSAMKWKKTADDSKLRERYGDLIADYEGGIDLKTTR